MCNTAESWITGHNSGQAVLNALWLVYFAIRDVIEDRITIVQLAQIK